MALEKKRYQHFSPIGIMTALNKARQWISILVFKTPASATPFENNKKVKKNNHVRTGVVKFFNRSKGFGFIFDENGVEIYVHNSSLRSRISQNDKVTFELEQNERGLKAVNVALN